MSYVNEKDAAARLTSASSNGNAILGLVGGRQESIVVRDPRRADGSLFPVSRPMIQGDSVSILRMLDPASIRPTSDPAGNTVVNFAEGDGGAGNVTQGPHVPSGFVHDWDTQIGGYVTEQTFEMEGSALTHNVSN